MYWDVSRIPASQEPAQPTPCFSSVPTTLGLPDTLLQNRLLQGLSEKRLTQNLLTNSALRTCASISLHLTNLSVTSPDLCSKLQCIH